MSENVLCSSWRVQVSEPEARDLPGRIRAQEEYIGHYLAPWLLDAAWVRKLTSLHFMRYLDPEHLQHIRGIAVVLRLLGDEQALAEADRSVRTELEEHASAGAIVRFESEPHGPWADSVIGEYGGPEVSEAWSKFLASSSWLCLWLLREPRHDFEARNLILANWSHCFGLVTRGIG